MGRGTLPAYRGSEPYAFVCYAHEDAGAVYSEMAWLHDIGLRLWYDEGISPGSEWSEVIAGAIEACAAFIYFVTPRSVAREHCRREVSYAIEQHREVVAIHLEPTELSRGLRLSLGHRQAVLKYQLPSETYRRVVSDAIHSITGPRGSAPDIGTAALSEDRVQILVSSQSGSGNLQVEPLATAISRYLSWQGGVLRAHKENSVRLVERMDYRIELTTYDRDDDVEISWQVYRVDTGQMIWAGQAHQSKNSYLKERNRTAEMIGEGALRNITDHELHRISGKDFKTLGYGRLLLKAEQPNYLDRARVADRLQALVRAIELQPEAGFAYASLASLLSWQILNGTSEDVGKDETKALEAARLALKFEPNDPFVLLNSGTTYCRLGRYEQGLGLIRRSCSMAPTVRAKDLLALCLCFSGHPEDAVPLFEEILETMPAGYTFPYVRFAVALTLSGRLDDALKFSQESVIHFPEDYYGWLIHANLLAQSVDGEERALRAVSEAQRLVPKLRLDTAIGLLESTYGRTPQQRDWLTSGLRILVRALRPRDEA